MRALLKVVLNAFHAKYGAAWSLWASLVNALAWISRVTPTDIAQMPLFLLSGQAKDSVWEDWPLCLNMTLVNLLHFIEL